MCLCLKLNFLLAEYSLVLFFIQSDNMCLLVGIYRLFIFNVTIDVVKFEPIILLFVFCSFLLFFVSLPLFLLPSFGLIIFVVVVVINTIQCIFISDSVVFISRISIWVFVVSPISLLKFLNVLIYLSGNQNICVSVNWLIFILIMGYIFLLFCMPSNFLLDTRHFKFYLIGCQIYLYSFKWACALFWDSVFLKTGPFEFCFKISQVGLKQCSV